MIPANDFKSNPLEKVCKVFRIYDAMHKKREIAVRWWTLTDEGIAVGCSCKKGDEKKLKVPSGWKYPAALERARIGFDRLKRR